ncbi:MAG: phosphatase PAP2 family protein [Candidatus Aenigmarchaeota archaeon]|nr:phosphatase PAP2 family protein [Candidatus Aenigmarchaeota archaeon]
MFKIWFQVPRPCLELSQCPTGYSFPSGHAAVIFAFASIFSLETKKKKFCLAAFMFAILVALSRVFLNYHTYADILAGALVGMFCGYLIHAAYKTIPILLVEEKVRKKRKSKR